MAPLEEIPLRAAADQLTATLTEDREISLAVRAVITSLLRDLFRIKSVPEIRRIHQYRNSATAARIAERCKDDVSGVFRAGCESTSLEQPTYVENVSDVLIWAFDSAFRDPFSPCKLFQKWIALKSFWSACYQFTTNSCSQGGIEDFRTGMFVESLKDAIQRVEFRIEELSEHVDDVTHLGLKVVDFDYVPFAGTAQETSYGGDLLFIFDLTERHDEADEYAAFYHFLFQAKKSNGIRNFVADGGRAQRSALELSVEKGIPSAYLFYNIAVEFGKHPEITGGRRHASAPLVYPMDVFEDEGISDADSGFTPDFDNHGRDFSSYLLKRLWEEPGIIRPFDTADEFLSFYRGLPPTRVVAILNDPARLELYREIKAELEARGLVVVESSDRQVPSQLRAQSRSASELPGEGREVDEDEDDEIYAVEPEEREEDGPGLKM